MAGEKVLIVDDREDNLQFLGEYILASAGYAYITARDGFTGLQKALTERPDLIIMDIRMPGLSGLEVLENLNQRGLRIPVILMTFHGSEETAVKAFRLGARDYVIKPFGADEMYQAMDRALSETRLRQEKNELGKVLLRSNEQLTQRIKELNALFGIGKSVTSLLDLEKVLNRIVEASVYLTQAEEGALLMVDEASGELYMRAARNLGETYSRGFRLKVDDSIAGRVVKTGQPAMMHAEEGQPGIQNKDRVPGPLPAQRPSEDGHPGRWRPVCGQPRVKPLFLQQRPVPAFGDCGLGDDRHRERPHGGKPSGSPRRDREME